jgi:adenylate cyclase class 2
MIIRPATKTDIRFLNIIKNKEMDELFLKRLHEMEDGKSTYLVAEDNGEVVGHVLLKYYGISHLPDFPFIEDLAVRTDQRRKGIGTALIKECEKLAQEKCFDKIGIQVNPDKTCPAHVMYEKLGFKDVGNKPYLDGVYDGVEDWVIDMSKDLNTYTEFEAKFYPIDKEAFREKLKKLGAKLIIPERKMRRAIVDQVVYPQIMCDYVRVRDEGNVIRLSSKIHAREGGSLSDQKEIDVEVSDYDKTIKIIESLGFNFTIYQETLRETWDYKGAEITIDTWPGLETLSEIEAHSEEEVKQLAEELGHNWDKRIVTSVKEIFMKKYGLSKEEATEKLNYITFENNPFAK